MALPYNSYDQLRYRGNEYVTDQVLNRAVYRFYQNDVYLDRTMMSHIENDTIHNYDSEDGTNTNYLTQDKLVILSCNQRYDVFAVPPSTAILAKGWQRLIDEQPRNLGGKTLIFRFQPTLSSSANPTSRIYVSVPETLKFQNFFGGTLIIEGPPAGRISGGVATTDQTHLSADNIKLVLTSNYENTAAFVNTQTGQPIVTPVASSKQNVGGSDGSVFQVYNAKCHVFIQNCWLAQLGIGTDPSYITSVPNSSPTSAYKEDGLIYGNWNQSGTGVTNNLNAIRGLKRFYDDSWLDLNLISALEVIDSPDVLIRHCYFSN